MGTRLKTLHVHAKICPTNYGKWPGKATFGWTICPTIFSALFCTLMAFVTPAHALHTSWDSKHSPSGLPGCLGHAAPAAAPSLQRYNPIHYLHAVAQVHAHTAQLHRTYTATVGLQKFSYACLTPCWRFPQALPPEESV